MTRVPARIFSNELIVISCGLFEEALLEPLSGPNPDATSDQFIKRTLAMT